MNNSRDQRPCGQLYLGAPLVAGHIDFKVTMTVYAHGRLDEKAAALSQLGAAVAGA